MNEKQVLKILSDRHRNAEGWLFLEHVRSGTGYPNARSIDLDSQRTIDGFAMNLWPSTGFRRVAYEVKVARGDLRHELRDPVKRVRGYLMANEFWFAVTPECKASEDVLMPNELLGAGVMEVRDDGNVRVLVAPVRNRVPWPMPPDFVASLIRRAYDTGRELNAESFIDQEPNENGKDC